MFALLIVTALALPADLAEIHVSVVDPEATGYGTFQSHNQKVVSTRNGVFMTHIRTRNEPYTAQTWRLSRSRQGASKFETVFEATHATNPAVIEADSQGTIHLVRPDFVDGNAYYYRFEAGKSYRDPRITVIPRGSAGKFALMLDEPRGRLYYFAHNNTFHVLDLDGNVVRGVDLLRQGTNAALQYPLLSLDAAGRLFAAWTTQAHGRYLYWDIHCLRSKDGGATWTTLAGLPLELPIVCDDGGPSDRVSLAEEFESHTWLSSFIVRDDKLHFAYLAQTPSPRQHHVRIDASSGRRRRDRFPEWKGETLSVRNLDGFFASRSALVGSTLYYVSREASSSRLACLASDDGGESWYDYAVSKPVVNPYSIGGAREITADGLIIGSFTEQTGSTTDSGGGSRVCFFRFQAGLCHAQLSSCEVVGGDTRVVFAGVRGQPEMVRFRRESREVAELAELAELAEAQEQAEAPEQAEEKDESDDPSDPEAQAEQEALDELRQAKDSLVQARNAGEWTEWRRFEPRVTLKGEDRPRAYQLRSRLRVVGPEVVIPEPTGESK